MDVSGAGPTTLWLAGDVMTGRGIDQAFAESVDPRLHESYVKDARRYLELAEEESGPIPVPLEHDYPWGEALAEIGRAAPEARVINLETAVTADGEPWPGKGIHYRMHPANVAAVTAPGTDVCVLANNHVLDWGRAGLEETLGSLQEAGLVTAGAGRDLEQASEAATLEVPGGRLLVFALGAHSAGIPRDWAATADRSGVWFLEEIGPQAVESVAARIDAARRPGDRVLVSIHWGGNWGYSIPPGQRQLARALIEAAGVDVVHGHSSHHPKGIEVHRGRPILYGCGDLINDYEGIGGHGRFRPELTLLYFPRLESDGRLAGMELVPMRIRKLRLQRADRQEAAWLADRLSEAGEELGTGVELDDGGRLQLRWD
ncbi:MAG: CapA family protein [Acidobacteriota bacterium]